VHDLGAGTGWSCCRRGMGSGRTWTGWRS
jgi:hypothetical protein